MTNLPMLRTSERAAFKRCPQKWWWGFRQGLVLNGPPKQALWFGTGVHLCFAEYYIPGTKRGRDPRETWEEYCEGHFESVRTSSTYNGDEEDAWTDALELGKAMFEYYLQKYGPEENVKMLAPEQVFQLLIPHPDDRTKAVADMRGTFDGVYFDLEDEEYKLWEHKSASQIDTGHLMMDPQAGGYYPAANHLLRKMGLMDPKRRIKGINYNFLAKRKPHNKPRDSMGRYLNKDGSISKVQPADTLLREFVTRTPKENNRQIEHIGNEVLLMDKYRSGELNLIKNPTRDCKWDCEFLELCQTDEAGGDTEEFKKYAMHVVDPYLDHRQGAQNTKESVELNRRLLKKG